jgi:hypothetical protein
VLPFYASVELTERRFFVAPAGASPVARQLCPKTGNNSGGHAESSREIGCCCIYKTAEPV